MDELPDEFTVRGNDRLVSYEAEVFQINGQWYVKSSATPFVGPGTHFPPEPASEEHVEKLYTEYEVVSEA